MTRRHPSSEEHFIPSINLRNIPFRQWSEDLKIKREYIPVKSSAPTQDINDECKFLNWSNMQAIHTKYNINDLHRDVLKMVDATKK